MSTRPAIGTIGWMDLTVPDAPTVRDFYAAVAGWTWGEVPMGDYADYFVVPPDARAPVGGICHARGSNADLPAQWLIYITVADLDAAVSACLERGGSVVAGPRPVGETARYAVIRDPAGAACALYEEAGEH